MTDSLWAFRTSGFWFLFARSSSVPSLEQLCRTSWRRGTRSLRCEKPRESRCARRQGPEEGHRQEARCQGQGCAEGPEGNKERSQGRTRQGWRQAINILL